MSTFFLLPSKQFHCSIDHSIPWQEWLHQCGSSSSEYCCSLLSNACVYFILGYHFGYFMPYLSMCKIFLKIFCPLRATRRRLLSLPLSGPWRTQWLTSGDWLRITVCTTSFSWRSCPQQWVYYATDIQYSYYHLDKPSVIQNAFWFIIILSTF